MFRRDYPRLRIARILGFFRRSLLMLAPLLLLAAASGGGPLAKHAGYYRQKASEPATVPGWCYAEYRYCRC